MAGRRKKKTSIAEKINFGGRFRDRDSKPTPRKKKPRKKR